MSDNTNLEMLAVINDLDALISEIDNNPCMSSWVVRLVLKAIKDKAKKMALQDSDYELYLDNIVDVKALLN